MKIVISGHRQCKLPRPIIAVELGCRVPATVRQRYLNVLIDELLKIYDREEDAYERAVTEESQCYARSNSKTVYLNVVVNIINRIRKEKETTEKAEKSKKKKKNLFFFFHFLKLLLNFYLRNE